MMTGHEMLFALVALVVTVSLCLDIFGFVLRTLRRAKTKKNPVNANPDYDVLATMLKNMELSGLIKLTSGEDEKPSTKEAPQAEEQDNTNKKAA
jgi:hypothetical protein